MAESSWSTSARAGASRASTSTAALAGQLDTTFPRLRLIEFDYDRDSARLNAAGCLSRLIPLFAKPDADGRCSTARIEGSIKGEGAVAEITPRLLQLLP